MARIPDPWKCDMCSAPKQPSNGWSIGFASYPLRFITEEIRPVSSAAFSERKVNGIAIIPWDDKLADEEGATHLCGIECITKFVAKETEKAKHADHQR